MNKIKINSYLAKNLNGWGLRRCLCWLFTLPVLLAISNGRRFCHGFDRDRKFLLTLNWPYLNLVLNMVYWGCEEQVLSKEVLPWIEVVYLPDSVVNCLCFCFISASEVILFHLWCHLWRCSSTICFIPICQVHPYHSFLILLIVWPHLYKLCSGIETYQSCIHCWRFQCLTELV